ncbi:MAG: 2Fe-2S iron-sulfur cluster-binding protein [Burkholderiaceae bacterium]
MTTASTPQFHKLRVAHIEPQTAFGMAVSLDVPPELRAAYRFVAGQFVTLRFALNGQDVRRAYSICQSTPDFERSGLLRVGIKRVIGGLVSNHVNDTVRVGHVMDVMTPDGRFHTPLETSNSNHYLGIAGGSGITPLLSLVATTLALEPNSRFTLLYGNRSTNQTMFAEELQNIKDSHMARFSLINVMSDEDQGTDILNGLLDRAKISDLLSRLVDVDTINDVFVCGPGPMMDGAEAALLDAGVDPAHVHIERFGSFTPAVVLPDVTDDTPAASLTFVIDGKQRHTRVAYTTDDGQTNDTVLEAGLRTGVALPFSCKAGNCCTCRAKVLSGEVRMLKNFALNAQEVADGFVLTCQCVPVSNHITISFDER